MNKSPQCVFNLTVVGAILLGLTGCKTPIAESLKLSNVSKLNQHMPWYDEEAPREGVPTRIVDSWRDMVHYQEGKTPTRGFGGKLFFYDEEGEAPILVDGELVVYAFNENGRAPTDNMPTRRYVFPATELSKLMDKSELGAGYNVWLPWDEAGGPKTEVSLMCRFESKEGVPLVSKQTRHSLIGEETAASFAAGGQRPKIPEGVHFTPAVEQAGFIAIPGSEHSVTQASANMPADATPRRMNATTIMLPNSMQNLGPGMPVQQQGQPATAMERMGPMLNTPVGTNPQTSNTSNGGAESRLAAVAAGNTVPSGYRLSQAPRGGLKPGIGALNSGSTGLNASTQKFPPPVEYQQTPGQPAFGLNAANHSAQESFQGYNNHPLASPAHNPITPIGGTPNGTNAATVQY